MDPLYALIVLIPGSIILPLWGMVKWQYSTLSKSWENRLADKEHELESKDKAIEGRDKIINLILEDRTRNHGELMALVSANKELAEAIKEFKHTS